MSDFEIIQSSELDYFYVTRKSSMAPEQISKAMGEGFHEVWNFMQANAIPPAGGGLSVYYDYSENEMEFRVGFVIAREDAPKAAAPVMAGRTPATRVLHAVHTGPYSGLAKTYEKLMSDMKWNGLHYGKPTWEVYLNDSNTTPEAELKTEIFMTLA